MKFLIWFLLVFLLWTCTSHNEIFVEKCGKFDFKEFRGKSFGHRGGIIYSNIEPSSPVYYIALDSCNKTIAYVKELQTGICIPDSLYNKKLLERLTIQFKEMKIASLRVDSNLNIWVQAFYDEKIPRVAYFSTPDSISGEYFRFLYHKYRWKPMKYGWVEQILSR
jgi:hypothetical protein